MKKLNADRMASEVIEPIIQALERAPAGTKTRFLEYFNRRSDQPVVYAHLKQWLDPNPSRRRQPRLGSGLLLMMVWSEWQEEARGRNPGHD